MKKYFVLVVVLELLAGLELNTNPKIASAFTCTEGLTPRPNVNSNNEFGATVINAYKKGPDYPIVIGQDPEEFGVNLTIDIASVEFDFRFSRQISICEGTYYEREGVTECDPGEGKPTYPEYPFFYNEYSCEVENLTLWRPILVNSIKTWLTPVPSADTEAWLGSEVDKDRNPLRFVYPEKWSLGMWIPGGFESIEGGQLWAGYQIEQFAEENPGFNFLKADPRETSYLSRRLPLVMPPESGLGQTDNAWGLYGDFGIGGGFFGLGGGCLFDTPSQKDGGCHPHYSYSRVNPGEVTGISLDLNNVPLDLPGRWQINIWFQTGYASVRRGGVTYREPDIDPEYLTITPPNGYLPSEKNEFETYIWLTTPCNPLEHEGCTSNKSSPP